MTDRADTAELGKIQLGRLLHDAKCYIESLKTEHGELLAGNAQLQSEKAEERRIAGEAWAQIRVLEQTVYDLRCEKESLERDLDKSLKGEADAVAACDANWVQHQRIVKAEQQLKQANELLRQVQTLNVLDGDGFHWITSGIAAHLCMQSKEIK